MAGIARLYSSERKPARKIDRERLNSKLTHNGVRPVHRPQDSKYSQITARQFVVLECEMAKLVHRPGGRVA